MRVNIEMKLLVRVIVHWGNALRSTWYKQFGENATKSIDIIFAARDDKLDHTTLDRDKYFAILLEALHPAFVKPDADFMKLAEDVSWKLDLLKHSGLDRQEKLNEIPGWKAKWGIMDQCAT